MKNKELLLRRMRTLEGKLKRLKSHLNEKNWAHAITQSRKEVEEILELKEDIDSIIEREN